MSGAEIGTLVTLIDRSIADSDSRIQSEVGQFVDAYPDEVGQQIAMTGFALIPTFAGYYRLTEEQLDEIARSEQSGLELAAV